MECLVDAPADDSALPRHWPQTCTQLQGLALPLMRRFADRLRSAQQMWRPSLRAAWTMTSTSTQLQICSISAECLRIARPLMWNFAGRLRSAPRTWRPSLRAAWTTTPTSAPPRASSSSSWCTCRSSSPWTAPVPAPRAATTAPPVSCLTSAGCTGKDCLMQAAPCFYGQLRQHVRVINASQGTHISVGIWSQDMKHYVG